MNSTRLYTKPQSCPDDMKTLNSRGSGVQDKHITFRVPHDLQDMGMAAYEYVRPVFVDEFSCPGVIASRVAADMGHQHLHALTFEEAVHGVCEAKVVIVTVARDSDQRLELRDFLRQAHASSEISCMPDLIDRSKEFPELRVEDPVCIRYESYVHGQSFMNIFFL